MSDSSSGQIIGGIIGAVVGYFTGGLSIAAGAGIGAAIGGYIGAEDQTVTGPRRDDLNAQTSTYGKALPFGYGTDQIAGNVFWLEGNQLQERVEREDVGGKGGGGTTRETYSYFATFAISLLDHEVLGVRRIWADAELVYDATGNQSPSSILEGVPVLSGEDSDTLDQISGSQDKGGSTPTITLYRGSQTQKPNARMEADKGPCPAYRGTAWMMLEDIPLEKYGNRIPSIRVEVVVPQQNQETMRLVMVKQLPWPGVDGNALDDAEDYAFVDGDSLVVNVNPASPTGNQQDGGQNVNYVYDFDGNLVDQRNGIHPIPGSSLEDDIYVGVWGYSRRWHIFQGANGRYPINGYREQRLRSPGTLTIAEATATAPVRITTTSAHGLETGDSVYISGTGIWAIDNKIWAINYLDWNRFSLKVSDGTGSPASTTGTAAPYATQLNKVYTWPNSPSSGDTLAACLTPDRRGLFQIFFDKGANTVEYRRYEEGQGAEQPVESGFLVSGPGGSRGGNFDGMGQQGAFALEDNRLRLWVAGPNTRYLYHKNSDGDFEVVAKKGIEASPVPSSTDTTLAKAGVCWNFRGNEVEVWTTAALLEQQSTTLQALVEDLAERSGYDLADIDASALTQDVRGYTSGRVTSMRGILQQLRSVFPFDVIEDGYTMRFVPRGGSPVATLTDDDLAAREEGQEPADIVGITRTLETDIPRRIHLTYKDADRSYEAGDQYASRIVTESERVAKQDLPIVFTATEAARAVDVMLRDAWANQETLSIVTSWKHLGLQPADIVTLDTSRYSGQGRLRQVDDGRPGLMKMQLAPDDSGIYTSNAAGGTGDAPDDAIRVVGPTTFELMDLPVLRDRDDNAGYYYAMTGGSGWPGAQLFRERSDEQFAAVGASTERAIIGYTTTKLPAGPTTVWDRAGTVNVFVNGGTLASKTEEEVLAGANTVALATPDGWEILRFANAELEADGTYTLSMLLRGKKGTEWTVDRHTKNDRLVFLTDDGSIQRVPRDLDTIGQERTYRGVTMGLSLSAGSQATFTYDGVNLKPYSPVHVRGERNASGDLTITWIRRTRIGGEWRNDTEVPLSEQVESYDIEIMDGSGGVARTLTTTDTSLTYPASDQTNDFGSPQAAVTVRIYQYSAAVGRGRKAEATL